MALAVGPTNGEDVPSRCDGDTALGYESPFTRLYRSRSIAGVPEFLTHRVPRNYGTPDLKVKGLEPSACTLRMCKSFPFNRSAGPMLTRSSVAAAALRSAGRRSWGCSSRWTAWDR